MSKRNEWYTGELKNYNNEKGFGFITCHEDRNDYFIHISNVITQPVKEKEQVIYKLAPSRKKTGTLEAVELHHIDKFDDKNVLVQKYFDTSNYELHSAILQALPEKNFYQIVSKELSSYKQLHDQGHFKKYKSNVEWFLERVTSKQLKSKVSKLISDQLREIASDDVKYTAWIDGFSKVKPTLQTIVEHFLGGSQKLRTDILQKINLEERKALFLKLLELDKSEIVLKFLVSYQKSENKTEFIREIFESAEFNEIASDDLKYRAWLEGFYEREPPFNIVKKHFLKGGNDVRDELFLKLNQEKKKNLLVELLKKKGAKNALKFITWYLMSINQIEKVDSVNKSSYWEGKKGYSLLQEIIDYVQKEPNGKYKFEFYKHGFIKECPIEFIKDNIYSLSLKDFDLLFSNGSLSGEILHDILFHLLELDDKSKSDSLDPFDNFRPALVTGDEDELGGLTERLQKVLELAKKYLEPAKFDEIMKEFVNSNNDLRLHLWKAGYVETIPYELIKAKLWSDTRSQDDLEELFDNSGGVLKDWLDINLITVDELKSIVLYNISNTHVMNRFDLNKVHEQINVLRENGIYIDYINEKVPDDTQEFINLLYWLDEDDKPFSFEKFRNKLTYLQPEQQQIFLKKLFRLAHVGEFELTTAKLKSLVDVDLKAFYKWERTDRALPIDVSVHIIVEAINSFAEKGEFLVDGELLKIVLNDLSVNSEHEVLISDFFDKCEGRMVAEWNWDRNGEVRKVPFGKDKYYYAIEFSPGENKTVSGNWGHSYQRFVPNPRFQHLKEEVKKLPKRKWNPDENHWGVPAKYKSEVLDFAVVHDFFINDDGSNYKNNIHFVNLERDSIPLGINFCEGREAKKDHDTLQRPFWWCCNEPCFQNCETFHEPDDWEAYTLLDFCEIMKLNTDDVNRVGDTIKKGKYYQFVSTINRFNRLLDRLYCESCRQILNPVDDSHFAHYRVTRFHCNNRNCDQYHKEVYLHHCFNGKCNEIIDSRISAQCPNGLYICSNTDCGSCCSNRMLNKRYENLKLTGGYIHPGDMANKEKLTGHLERDMYFCYECGNEMDNEKGKYVCKNCDISYGLSIKAKN